MPVPSRITDLTTVAATNSPLGSESPATADDYFRAHASFIAQLNTSLVKQAGVTDATAGRLLTVGAFGLGGPAISSSNLNAITAAGMYSTNTATTPGRPIDGYWAVLHMGSGAGNDCQYAASIGTPNAVLYTRSQLSGTWGSWRQVMAGQTALLAPTLFNGFIEVNALRYSRSGNTVTISGTIGRAGAWPALAAMFVLPVGYRPANTVSVVAMVVSNNLALQMTNIAFSVDGVVASGVMYNIVGTPDASVAGSTFGISFNTADAFP